MRAAEKGVDQRAYGSRDFLFFDYELWILIKFFYFWCIGRF